jgi:hypothetical protein
MVGFTVSLKSIGKRVDSPALLLAFLSSFVGFNIKFVLKSVNLSPEGQFSFFLSNFLFFFVSEQVLDFFVLVPDDPIELIDLCDQRFDFVIMSRENASGLFLLKVSVLDFDVDDLRSVQLFKLEDLVSEVDVLQFEIFQLLVVSDSQIFVVGQLVFKLVVFVVIGSF